MWPLITKMYICFPDLYCFIRHTPLARVASTALYMCFPRNSGSISLYFSKQPSWLQPGCGWGWVYIKVSLGRVISGQQKHWFCSILHRERDLRAKMVECLQVIAIHWHKSDLMAATEMLHNALLVPYWYLSASWTEYLSAHTLSLSLSISRSCIRALEAPTVDALKNV